MPAPTTVPEFLALIERSGLLDAETLSRYLEQLRSAPNFPETPDDLANQLIRDGRLTRFQAFLLLDGKCRQFTLGGYKVLDRIGAGGMGSVYLCEDRGRGTRAALKVLAAARALDPTALERFQREARAVARLDHPNVVHAFEVGQDQGLHYLALEYVDGATLQDIVGRGGPLAPEVAANYLAQAALGLQHAHEHGLVHRDIKPANLVVSRNGVLKVLDLGLARFADCEDDGLTRESNVGLIGTADYLAPEQAVDSHDVDIRADLYSLGATFYFCLTGTPPFPGGSAAQKLLRHMHRDPDPVRSRRPAVPEGLASLIERLLAKNPADRYATPGDVAAAAATFIAPGSVKASAGDSAIDHSTVVHRLEAAPLPEIFDARQVSRPPIRRRRLAVRAVLLLLSATGLAGLAWWLSVRPGDSTVAPSSVEPTAAAPEFRLGRSYPSGFPSTAGLQLNGSARVAPGSRILRLTDRELNQAGSAFSTERLAVDCFKTQFDFLLRDARADGFAFVIQAGTPEALGGIGGALGYYGDPKGRMARSLALKFDLWNNSGEGENSTGLFLNGALPTVGGVAPREGKNDLNGTGIDLHAGRMLSAAIDYDGARLRVKLSDATTGASTQQVYAVDIPEVIGGATAYVGFTGCTGGASAVQEIHRWTFFPQ
jgi:serine/threonine protein kinase